jgi:multiple sugar transport system substrate-binding protein
MKSSAEKIVLATVLVVAAAGPCPADATSAQASRAPKKTGTLTVWLMPNGPGDNARSFLDLVQPFVNANPGIKIDAVLVPWGEALSRIEAAVDGRGPAPDITQLGTTWVAAVAARGHLLDLKGTYDEKLFPPQILTTTEVAGEPRYAGKRFALPWLVDTRAIYFNRDYCKQAGVDPEKDFATWSSFHVALQRLKRATYRGAPVAPLGVTLSNWNVIHNLSPWIWGAGGGFVGDAKTPGIASPQTLYGIEYYVGLAREGLLSPIAEQGDPNLVAQMLRQGAIATTISYPIGPVPEETIGIAPIPAGPQGRFTFLGGSVLAVLKSSKHPQEAIDLLRYLSTEGAQLQYSMVTGGLVATAGQYDELLLQLDPIRRAFVAQMKYGRAYPSLAVWGEIEVVLRDGLSALWVKATGAEPYDRAAAQRQLQDMQKKIDGIVERRGRPSAK